MSKPARQLALFFIAAILFMASIPHARGQQIEAESEFHGARLVGQADEGTSDLLQMRHKDRKSRPRPNLLRTVETDGLR